MLDMDSELEELDPFCYPPASPCQTSDPCDPFISVPSTSRQPSEGPERYDPFVSPRDFKASDLLHAMDHDLVSPSDHSDPESSVDHNILTNEVS